MEVDAFNREFKGITKENEDLPLIETLTSEAASPLKGRSGMSVGANSSKKKSGVKKKKGKGRRGEEIQLNLVEANTFYKLDNQAELVSLIIKDQDVEGELDTESKIKLQKLLKPFSKFGSEFPPFVIERTRENMQRAVVKAA